MHCKTNKIESEEHFILECTNYNEERSLFFKELKLNGIHYWQDGGISILRGISKENKLTVLNEFGKFLKKCWDKRDISKTEQNHKKVLVVV